MSVKYKINNEIIDIPTGDGGDNTWIGTQAEYEAAAALIPDGTFVGITDDGTGGGGSEGTVKLYHANWIGTSSSSVGVHLTDTLTLPKGKYIIIIHSPYSASSSVHWTVRLNINGLSDNTCLRGIFNSQGDIAFIKEFTEETDVYLESAASTQSMSWDPNYLERGGMDAVMLTSGGVNSISANNVTFNNAGTDIESTNVQDAIKEAFTSASNGKELVASAITGKGVPTLATDTFETMADNIEQIGSDYIVDPNIIDVIYGNSSGLNVCWYVSVAEKKQNTSTTLRLQQRNGIYFLNDDHPGNSAIGFLRKISSTVKKIEVDIEVVGAIRGEYNLTRLLLSTSPIPESYLGPGGTLIKEWYLNAYSSTPEKINNQADITINSTDQYNLSRQTVVLDLTNYTGDKYLTLHHCDSSIYIRSIKLI